MVLYECGGNVGRCTYVVIAMWVYVCMGWIRQFIDYMHVCMWWIRQGESMYVCGGLGVMYVCGCNVGQCMYVLN